MSWLFEDPTLVLAAGVMIEALLAVALVRTGRVAVAGIMAGVLVLVLLLVLVEWLVVTDVEQRLGTRYTADTLEAFKVCFARTHFVWLMGADNLVQISDWQSWTRIFSLVPIAIFDRAPYSFDALAGKAAHAFARFKLRQKDAGGLVVRGPPAWIFFHTRLHPGSATEIRAGRALRRIHRRRDEGETSSGRAP